MTRIAIMALGSFGDINPFLGLGVGLARRGHTVHFITNDYYRRWVEGAGLAFVPLGTRQAFEAMMANPDLWHPERGFELAFGIAADWSGEGFERLKALDGDGLDVVVAPFQCYGARLAREVLGVPLLTVLPNPIMAESVHDPVRYSVLRPLSRLGPLAARLLYAIVDRVYDGTVRPRLNRLRRTLGLEALPWVGPWQFSPDAVVGLWPDWLRGPQRDWPPQMRLTGFITYDGPSGEDASVTLGGKPIVFTPGTAMVDAKAFFAAGLAAVEALGADALFVTRFADQLPARLPDRVKHLPFAPFATLFAQASAVVHHGGIGTAARALAAGVPQLIMPTAHDQFDNAHLLARAGVGATVLRRDFTGPVVAATLRRLLNDPAVAHACADGARALAAQDPLSETCDLIEALAVARRHEQVPATDDAPQGSAASTIPAQ